MVQHMVSIYNCFGINILFLNLNIVSIFGTKLYTKAIDACFSKDYM